MGCLVRGYTGEINTLQGNLNWVASREHSLTHPIWNGRESELLPLCNASESDSANLDHLAELMFRTDVDPQEALMVLVPEAYRNHPELNKHYPEVGDLKPCPYMFCPVRNVCTWKPRCDAALPF